MTIKPFKLERGIKVPPPSNNSGVATEESRTSATLKVMSVGESFLVRDPLDAVRSEKIMRDFLGRERKRNGKRAFVSRRVKQGVRIWRTG